MPSTQKKMDIAKRRDTVAEMYLTGHRQSAIAAELGVSQGTISNDLKAIHKQWLKDMSLTIDEHKNRELAKIDALETEYWQQYRLSQQPKTTTTEKQGIRDAGTGKGKVAEKTTRTEQREGDPRWLQRVEWCIEKRIKILGVEAPIKSELKHDGNMSLNFTDIVSALKKADEAMNNDAD